MRSHEASRRASAKARRLALGAVFEADFGQHTATQVLERRLEEEHTAPAVAKLAREIVAAVVVNRDRIDAQIEAVAPAISGRPAGPNRPRIAAFGDG